jgi:hypothetical protein
VPNKPFALASWRRYLLSLVAVLVLAQTADSSHLHSELDAVDDCTICCLHLSTGDAASQDSLLIDLPELTLLAVDALSTEIYSQVISRYSIRGPPAFTASANQ